MNQAQLDVCAHKLSSNFGSDLIEIGKFEYLFELVREYFINYKNEQMILHYHAISDDALNYVIQLVFDEKILSTLFSEEATKYSKQSFSDHFKSTYAKMLNDINDITIKNKNSENVILGTKIIDSNNTFRNRNKVPITFLNQSAQTVLSQENKYHLIDLSNIGDWMPYEDFQQLITTAFEKLHKNGCLVLRRLLGDYSLMHLAIGKIIPLYDETGFYSQTVMIKK
jgi:hypothetical protein